jgi:AraC-like DNA-binding protein
MLYRTMFRWNFHSAEEVQLVWGQKGFTYTDHVHDEFNIDFVRSGQLEYRLAGRTFLVTDGQMVWINPHEVHSATVINEVTPSIASLLIPKTFMDSVAVRITSKTVHRLIDSNFLCQQFLDLHEAANKAMNLLEVETRLIEMLSYVVLNYSMDYHPRCDSHNSKAVEVAKSYLLERFAENIRLSDLSNLVQLSRPYLVRLFREEVGLPPYSYLTQIRLEKARKLLKQGVHPAEVAAAVGLCDQSHLIRFFRRSTGITPGAFVKEHAVK